MQILRANIINVSLTDAYVNEYAETDERHHHITGGSLAWKMLMLVTFYVSPERPGE
jgi:hypothetical protein